MDIKTYQDFTRRLTGTLASQMDVVGLVAVGSMAERDYPPDEWSDHDFYIITQPGQQTRYFRFKYCNCRNTEFYVKNQRSDIDL